jgi:hypothetical protein
VRRVISASEIAAATAVAARVQGVQVAHTLRQLPKPNEHLGFPLGRDYYDLANVCARCSAGMLVSDHFSIYVI